MGISLQYISFLLHSFNEDVKGYRALSVFTGFKEKKLIDLSIYHRCSINRVYRIFAT